MWVSPTYPVFRKVNLQLTPQSSNVTSSLKPALPPTSKHLSQLLVYFRLNAFFLFSSLHESIHLMEL